MHDFRELPYSNIISQVHKTPGETPKVESFSKICVICIFQRIYNIFQNSQNTLSSCI